MATAWTRPLTISSWLRIGSRAGWKSSSCACESHGMSRATSPVPVRATSSSAATYWEKKSLCGHGCVSTQVRRSASEPWTSCRATTAPFRMYCCRAACLRRRLERLWHMRALAFHVMKKLGPSPPTGFHGAQGWLNPPRGLRCVREERLERREDGAAIDVAEGGELERLLVPLKD
eukprot:3506171-Pyramimonas_sp.AAC.1